MPELIKGISSDFILSSPSDLTSNYKFFIEFIRFYLLSLLKSSIIESKPCLSGVFI